MDISLSNISDLISVSTIWGFVAFIAIAIVYAVGQYLILDFVKQKSKSIRLKSPYFDKLSTIITIVQYVLTATIMFIILQIFEVLKNIYVIKHKNNTVFLIVAEIIVAGSLVVATTSNAAFAQTSSGPSTSAHIDRQSHKLLCISGLVFTMYTLS